MRTSAAYLLAIILPAAPLVAAVACHPGRTYCALELLGQGYTDADTLTRYAQHAGHRAEPTCNSLWVCEEDYSFRFIIECPKICWPGTHGAYCKEDWQYSSAG